MKEPVLLGLTPAIVVGLLGAVLNVSGAFGLVVVTPEQRAALNELIIQVFTVLAILGAWYARSKVTPT